jgi:hypothetical protein
MKIAAANGLLVVTSVATDLLIYYRSPRRW